MARRPQEWRGAPPRPGGAPAGPAAAPPAATRVGVEDALLEAHRPWYRVPWSLSYLGFLGYVFAVTTFVVGIANAAMVVALVALAPRFSTLRFPPFFIWMALLFAWALYGYFQSVYRPFIGDELIAFGKIGLVAFTAANVLRTRPLIRFYVLFFLACYALYPVRGTLMNYFVTHDTMLGRAIWNRIFSNPNDLAAITLFPFSMALGVLAVERTRWIRLSAMIGLGVMPLVILLTQSRAVIIALALFVLLLVITQRERLRAVLDRKRRARLAIAAVVVLAAVLVATPKGTWKRLRGLGKATSAQNLGEVDAEGSAKQRYEIWRVASAMIRDHPVSGVGFGMYPRYHYMYAQNTRFLRIARGFRDTHSTYLNILAETGIPGLVMFLGMIIASIIPAERTRRRCWRTLPRASLQLAFLELGLVAFLAAGIFGTYAKIQFLYLHLALMWAVAWRCEQDLAALRGAARPMSRGPAPRGWPGWPATPRGWPAGGVGRPRGAWGRNGRSREEQPRGEEHA